MKKTIFFLSIIFLITIVSALVCTDSFALEQEVIQICGYCEEANGSICGANRACNFTIYYSNFTLFGRNLTGINNLDGSFTHNVTQNLSGGEFNLTSGNYIGEMYCGARSRDSLSFKVKTPITSGVSGAYGGGRTLTIHEDQIIVNRTINRIPKDIKDYWNKTSNRISDNKSRGKLILFFCLLIFILSPEIYFVTKKVRLRRKF